jgi:hypothetical protein
MRIRILLSGLMVLCQFGLALASLFTGHSAYADVASAIGPGTLDVMMATVPGTVGAPSQIYTGELIQRFRTQGNWMGAIPILPNFAAGPLGSKSIHFTDIGGDPTVLINTTTYPIPAAVQNDTDIVVALDRYDTTNTIITDEEVVEADYDKISLVVDKHYGAMDEGTRQKGRHNLTVTSNTGTTPVLVTTGAESILNPGFKALIQKDLILLKKKLDDLNVPSGPGQRVLILGNTHVNELLLDSVDGKNLFRDIYANTATGAPINVFGFSIYEDSYEVMFNAAGSKKAFGAVAAVGDRPSSTLVVKTRAFRAIGWAKTYMKESVEDPYNRETVAGMRLYHTMLPKKNTGFAAIISAPTA